MPGAMLSISSNGADTSSAIVWACFPTSGNANNQVRPGTIAAYRANDVSAGELWNSDQNKNDVIGNFAKFNTPTIANGKVFVPTFSKAIKVYGISCSAANLQYGNGYGLKGEYFTNSSPASGFPSSATLVQPDPSINFNWGNGSPLPGISAGNFKIRWTGKLRPFTDDNYTIYVTANDGVRLWINNTLLIDSWTDKTVTTHSGNIALLKATDYDIRIEYYSALMQPPAYCNGAPTVFVNKIFLPRNYIPKLQNAAVMVQALWLNISPTPNLQLHFLRQLPLKKPNLLSISTGVQEALPVSAMTFSKQGLQGMYKALIPASILFMLLQMMASGFG